MRTHDQAVHDQFDPQAQAYLQSGVHARGPDLQFAQELVAGAVASLPGVAARGDRQALDVGCGAGHLSFALAPTFGKVVALDPSEGMLAAVEHAARTRGLLQIETRQSAAESIAFADSAFSLAATRYSAHHWCDLGAGLREMRRVLAPGGALLVIDVLGADDPLVDTHLQTLELLRDPSHVRNRAAGEWLALIEALGFTGMRRAQWSLRLEFSSWVGRMRTPPARVAVIRELQQSAAREVQEGLAFEADGSFTVRTGLFWARKPG